MPANASFDKGASVEEWTDTIFFRPLGLRIAKAAFPTSATPDQITAVSLIFGLIAGNLCFYQSVWLNALGVALFIVSDIFDSADGQLARMRGTSTRLGKILDGLSDGARFANLYVTLIVRLVLHSPAWLHWWGAVALGIAAGLAHARQSGAVDHIRQMFMYLAEGGRGEFALPEDAEMNAPRNAVEDLKLRFYRGYLEGNGKMLPTSTVLVRTLRAEDRVSDVSRQWARLQQPVVHQLAWIGQNIRFALLAVTVVPQHPEWYLIITLVPMSLVLRMILGAHERRARSIPIAPPQLAGAA